MIFQLIALVIALPFVVLVRLLVPLKPLPHRLRVVYKSGHVVTYRCKDWSCKKNGSELVSVTMTGERPHFVFLGIDSIESIYEVYP